MPSIIAFQITKLPLRSTREFIFENLVLQDELPGVDPTSPSTTQKVEQLCTQRIQTAIARSTERQLARENKEDEFYGSGSFAPPSEPLIRLRVDTSGGFDRFSALRFGQKFVNFVANPKVSHYFI